MVRNVPLEHPIGLSRDEGEPAMNEPELIADMLGGPALLAGPALPGGLSARPRRSLAVIGLSEKPSRPSHSVSTYMQAHGYRILPVNPAASRILGETCYPSLSALPEPPDVVNVFRLPQFLPEIVDEMIALGLRNLWIQLGIVHAEAAARAEAAGIRVVMDRCILIEHRRLLREMSS